MIVASVAAAVVAQALVIATARNGLIYHPSAPVHSG